MPHCPLGGETKVLTQSDFFAETQQKNTEFSTLKLEQRLLMRQMRARVNSCWSGLAASGGAQNMSANARRRPSPEPHPSGCGSVFCTLGDRMNIDTPIILVRTAAACVHPLAAWQVFSKAWRLSVVTVFAGSVTWSCSVHCSC